MAYYLLGLVHGWNYWIGSTPQESIAKGIEMAQKAIALDDTYAEAHATLSALYSQKSEYDKALAEGERAVALNPNGAYVIVRYASILTLAGRSEEAIPLLQKAIRLDPYGPGGYHFWLGLALFMKGRFEEAVLVFKKVHQRAPNHIGAHVMLSATYSKMGREKEARAETAEVLRINPKFSVDYWANMLPLRDQPKDDIINAVRKAGLK